MFHQYRKCHSILRYLPLSHLYLLLQDHIQDVLHRDTVEYGTADRYQKALRARHVYTVCHTLLGERCRPSPGKPCVHDSHHYKTDSNNLPHLWAESFLPAAEGSVLYDRMLQSHPPRVMQHDLSQPR